MNLSFSQRMGYEPVQKMLQLKSMDNDLWTGLWNVYYTNRMHGASGMYPDFVKSFYEKLYTSFFKKKINELLIEDEYREYDEDGNTERYLCTEIVEKEVEGFFATCAWYKIYDFLEFFLAEYQNTPDNVNGVERKGVKYDEAVKEINSVLEIENAGYRVVSGKFVPITNSLEIETVEDAVINTNAEYKGVNEHLRKALAFFSDKKQKDYPNVIKEAISAVESICCIKSGVEKGTLGNLLKSLEQKHKIHGALSEGFSKLYGYTSNEKGIRHANGLTENDGSVGFAEAKFMLVACSAFINYVIDKGSPDTDGLPF